MQRSAADPHGRLAHLSVILGEAPPDALVEVRYAAGAGMGSEFVPVRDRHAVEQIIDRLAETTDVYVACAPRTRPSGRKDAIEQVWTLWAECDGAVASAAARRFVPKPALVIASGTAGNVHAYWPLRRPLAPDDTERANLRLASAIGADVACFDASRILRPPGSWNHKHRPPRRVEVLESRLAVRFELDEVVGALRHVDTSAVDRRWRVAEPRQRGGDVLLTIPPSVYVGTLLGTVAPPGRKVRCPFHEDDRPSLHVYASPERGWCCFSCRRGGTIYDLAAALTGAGTRGRDFVRLREDLLARFAYELERVRARGAELGLGH